MNKTIYYFTLAANHKFLSVQANLGSIYYESEYIEQDMCKAIHFLTLAVNQNELITKYTVRL